MENIQETTGYSKEQILNLKNTIKTLVAEQKLLKPQRKTVHFTGERTVTAEDAEWMVSANKTQLRHMYIVYGMMKGKTIDQIETKGKNYQEPSKWFIDKLLKEFGNG